MRIFKSKIIREQLSEDELTALIDDFRQYKLTGVIPDIFGRDELYNHPNSLPIIKAEEVQHIHLLDGEKRWPSYTIQFYKTSDEHMVYCQGQTNSNCYLLIAILAPSAHKQARNNSVMYNIGKIAEKFRFQY